jgi:hypothetical protein
MRVTVSRRWGAGAELSETMLQRKTEKEEGLLSRASLASSAATDTFSPASRMGSASRPSL